jgi:hypothetical protein
MKSKISQVITGTTLLVVAVVSTIHSMNIRTQAIIDWVNADADVSYNSGYATAGAEFGLVGIICFIAGFVFLFAGLFKPVSNSRR